MTEPTNPTTPRDVVESALASAGCDDETWRAIYAEEVIEALRTAGHLNEWRPEDFRKFIVIRPVAVEGEPDACNVFLKVGVQEFCVTKYAMETAEEAGWMANMLAKALAAMVSPKPPGDSA